MPPELVPSADKTNVFAKPVTLRNRAYVTFLAGNGDYVKGVVGLANGLRKVKAAYPLALAYYVINYSKLRIWEFVEYSKMIYLDGDIQVYDNIDRLFDLADGNFYVVMDCFCEKTWSHTPQYKIGYCQQCPDKVKWPAKLGNPPPLYFNDGMFVFEPSLTNYESLLKTLEITIPTPFAEQDFLNMFFKDIYKPIPLIYNRVLSMLRRHPENVELEKVKGSKPWRYAGKEDIKMLDQKWWDIYNDDSLDFKEPTVGEAETEPVNLQPFLAVPPLSAAILDFSNNLPLED
ncbi:Galactinol synthase 1 [Hibiscus syriacus]|uniref:Hexosyltransferase n=1 Tax=Hibiscus syriacus TaxID=106335 RepID=A0A6A3A9M7_HIBSY|nr:Galactinol synthase 1 [Hibiscus syriacus]